MKNPVRSKGAEVGVKSEGANPGKAPLKRSWLAALTLVWGFGRGRRNPECGSQSAVWEVRPLGLDGRLGAHSFCFAYPLNASALDVKPRREPPNGIEADQASGKVRGRRRKIELKTATAAPPAARTKAQPRAPVLSAI